MVNLSSYKRVCQEEYILQSNPAGKPNSGRESSHVQRMRDQE